MELIRAVAKALVEIPLLIYLPVIVGLLTYRKYVISRKIVVAGVGLLIVLSFPVVPKILAKPLFSSVPEAQKNSKIDLIVVPTAGVIQDPVQDWQITSPAGQWRASFTSIHRVNAGLEARKIFKKPLLIIGGTPNLGEASEADTIVHSMGLDGAEILVQKTAKNSAETAQAIGKMTIKGKPVESVLVVTSREHILRMSLSLRKNGLKVYALPATTLSRWTDLEKVRNYYPNLSGLVLTSAMVREYVGIFWYAISGKIKFADLFQGAAE